MEQAFRRPKPHPFRMPARGLYAITREENGSPANLERSVAAALRGGARLVQYRDKSKDAARRRAEAETLLRLCRSRNVPLLINDDVGLALDIGAHGVHLGRDDPSLDSARKSLGPTGIIGISCYGDLDRGVEAEARGADYVAFGSFYPSETKPGAPPVGAEVVREARRRIRIPLVAIGGISPENGAALLEIGVDLLAVVTGLFASDDIESAARAYTALFRSERTRPDPSFPIN